MTKSAAPPKATPVTAPMRSILLQRKCACGGTPGPTGECEACRKKKLQQRAGNRPAPSFINQQTNGSRIPPLVHEVLRSPGQPLDQQTRAFMEPRFGHDFSTVRVHTDPRAAESAEEVNSLAYAVGHDIVFGRSQYAPHNESGRRLLSHELAHVVQQRAGVHLRSGVGEPGDFYEHHAEDVATAIAEGRSVMGFFSNYQPFAPEYVVGRLQRQSIGIAQSSEHFASDDVSPNPASSDPLLLTAAVGMAAENRADDVAKVQSRLRALGLLSDDDFAAESPRPAIAASTLTSSANARVADSVVPPMGTATIPSDSMSRTGSIDSGNPNASGNTLSSSEVGTSDAVPVFIPVSSLAKTIAAIREFQKVLFSKETVDGNIGPLGPTWRALSSVDAISFGTLQEDWEVKKQRIKAERAGPKKESARNRENQHGGAKEIETQRKNQEIEKKRTAIANKLLAMYATYLPFMSTYINIDESGLARVLAIYAKFDSKLVLKVFDALDDSDAHEVAFEMALHASDKDLAGFDHSVLERMTRAMTGWMQTSEDTEQINRIGNTLGAPAAGTKGKTAGAPPARTLEVFKLSGSVGKTIVVKGKSVPAANLAKDVKVVQQVLVVAGYMQADDTEVTSVSAIATTAPDSKVLEENLEETIEAIFLWQRKGATERGFEGNGQISKTGRSASHLKILADVYRKYVGEKPLEITTLILGADKWHTQARYGFNYGGGDENKALERAYKREVLKVAGIADPADLSTAPADKIAAIKASPKFSKSGKVPFYQTADVITYGIRERDKISDPKPNWICCFDTAKKMLGYSGATPHGESEKLQTFVENSHKNGVFTPQAAIGFRYIDGQLRNAKAVFIGVDKLTSDDNEYNEGVTDHFIVIVGKARDNTGWYFRYFDPGTTRHSAGTSENNKLHIAADYQSVAGEKYNVSQLRINEEEGI